MVHGLYCTPSREPTSHPHLLGFFVFADFVPIKPVLLPPGDLDPVPQIKANPWFICAGGMTAGGEALTYGQPGTAIRHYDLVFSCAQPLFCLLGDLFFSESILVGSFYNGPCNPITLGPT